MLVAIIQGQLIGKKIYHAVLPGADLSLLYRCRCFICSGSQTTDITCLRSRTLPSTMEVECLICFRFAHSALGYTKRTNITHRYLEGETRSNGLQQTRSQLAVFRQCCRGALGTRPSGPGNSLVKPAMTAWSWP